MTKKSWKTLQTSTRNVGGSFDPTIEQRADVTVGQWRLTIEEVWGRATVQILHEGKVLVDRNGFSRWHKMMDTPKVQHRLLQLLDLLFELEKYGRRMWGTLLWDKLPKNVNRALCMLRGHWWHYEDMGGPESGPGPIESHCLRCDAIEDPNSGGVTYFDYEDDQGGPDFSERQWEQAREWGADNEL